MYKICANFFLQINILIFFETVFKKNLILILSFFLKLNINIKNPGRSDSIGEKRPQKRPRERPQKTVCQNLLL